MATLRSVSRSIWQHKDYQLGFANPQSVAQLCSEWKHSNSQHKISGGLEPLKRNSALWGHGYSGCKRCLVKCYAQMKIVKTLHSGDGYSDHKKQLITNSAQIEIVRALRSGERSRASSLLSEMGLKNHSLGTSDFIHILKHCAKKPDPLFIKETERMMRESGVNMDLKCHSLIIRALCRGGLIEEAFKEINVLRDSCDLDPVLPMFNDLLGVCARSQSLRVNECLDLMEEQMVGKNEITYAHLLELAVSQGNLSSVQEIWKECIKYYNPDIVSLRKFIWSFSWLGDLKAADDILQKMVSSALCGDFSFSKTSSGRVSFSRLDVPIPSHSTFLVGGELKTCKNKSEPSSMNCLGNECEGAELTTCKRNLNQPVREILLWSFNVLIRSCARKSNSKLPEKLILQMQELGLEPSASTYDGFIKAVVAERGYHSGLELLKIMQQKKLKPHDSTLVTIATACSRALDLDLAETLLDQVSTSPTAHPYNSFLKACDTLDQPERALRVLAKMKEMKLLPNIRTYELLFSLFGNYNAPYEEGNILSQADVYKRLNAIEDNMVENNIEHSPTSLHNLLRALGREGMVSKQIQYLRMAENQLSRGYSCLTTSTYNVVLISLVEAEESHMAIELFKSMKSNGFPPDAATYEIMMNYCAIIRCSKSAGAIVSMMVRDGFYKQAVTYTSLIKVDRDIDEALQLLDLANREGIKPDVVLYNTFLDEACKMARIDAVELIVNKMLKNEIKPDPSTCFLVFSAYVDQDYIKTAMEALQVLSMHMISLEDSILDEKKTELEENYIFAEDSEVELRVLKLFKSYNEHLAVALLNLRWCATLGFEISWLPNQSPWVKRLSSSYGPVEGYKG